MESKAVVEAQALTDSTLRSQVSTLRSQVSTLQIEVLTRTDENNSIHEKLLRCPL
jgi:hypothetical protein